MQQFLTLILVALMSVSCVSREVAENDPDPGPIADVFLPVNLNRNIDILFVIDDSGSMAAEQQSLRQNFPKFIEALKNIPGGLPNVHIAITSTSVNAGSGCSQSTLKNGDGKLLTEHDPVVTDSPINVPECQGVGIDDLGFGPFIRDIEDENNPGQRLQNYNSNNYSLEELFGCIAIVGIDGCGFEQPLEAARKALENGKGMGFIREDALLAVIFVTDEDDCSAKNTGLFANATSGLDNHRCFANGVVCDPDSPETPGVKSNCQSRDNNQFITPLPEYVSYFQGFKSNPRSVIVAGIMGEATDENTGQSLVEVINSVDADNRPGKDLKKLCETPGEDFSGADPAVRMLQFLGQFPGRNTFQSICEQDLSGGLSQIGELLAVAAGSPCLFGNVADRDPDTAGIQPECIVEFEPDAAGAESKVIPACPDNMEPMPVTAPCYYFEVNTMDCNTETNLKINIVRPDGQNNEIGSDRVQCTLEANSGS